MVNSHEATRPTSLCRTWPNLVGGECPWYRVRGLRRLQPRPHLHLPFTRLRGRSDGLHPWHLETENCEQMERQHLLGPHHHRRLAGPLPDDVLTAADGHKAFGHATVRRRLPVHPRRGLRLDDHLTPRAEPADYITVARKAKELDDWFVGGKCGRERPRNRPMVSSWLKTKLPINAR